MIHPYKAYGEGSPIENLENKEVIHVLTNELK